MSKMIINILLGISVFATHANATGDFAYYESKTREFLVYYGYDAPESVVIKEIENHIQMPGWTIKAYRLKKAIYINSAAFAHEAEGVNLFTCAHEAAHLAFHSTTAKGYAIEEDADIKAAHMLCNNGYAWAVEEKINALHELIAHGMGNISDEKYPRPTIATQHEYLTKILDAYLAEHPLEAQLVKINATINKSLIAASHLIIGISGFFLGTQLEFLKKKIS